MKPIRNGGDAICAALRAAGVDTVFGVPGTQTIAQYEAFRRAGLRTVTATHETAATFMAQGYFRASGRLAVVSAIPGPGFAYALPALAEARLDSAGLVLLTGRPRASEDGRRRAQAIDQSAMARPIVKDVVDVETAAQVGGAVLRACHLAMTGEPGPVLVQCSENLYGDENVANVLDDRSADGDDRSVDRDRNRDTGIVDGDALDEAVRFVAAARRVLIYAGQGALGAAAELRQAVDRLGALLATTPSGRGVLPEDDERVMPLDATADAGALNAIADECDAVLVLGAALAENGSVGSRLRLPSERLLRVDASSDVLRLPPGARYSVRSTTETFLAALLRELAGRGRDANDPGFDASAARARRARFQDRRANGPADARIAGETAARFFEALRRGMSDESCLVLDSGLHQLLARRYFTVCRPRGLLFPSDFQSMGFGLPAAIGAKLADPHRAVVALIGDGGLAMTGLELTTAVRLKLTLPVVVFDNGALGLIRMDQLLAHGRAHATDLGTLDFESLARAVGCDAVWADAGSIEAEIHAALGRRGPTLVIVPVQDAPALTRARVKRHANQALKALLGPRLIGVLCRLRRGVLP